MSEKIANVGLYQQTLNNNIKFPIGNTGEDTAFTLNIGQIKDYIADNINIDYGQVLNTPAIGNAAIEIFQNGQLAGRFSLNQSENVTISLNGGGGGGEGRWGDITGDIYQQRDLIQLMDDKFNGLAAVASSGSYNDLSNKPTIGNGSIVIRQAGQQKGNFTLNQTGSLTINLDGVQYTETVAGANVVLDVKGSTIYKCSSELEDLKITSVENSQFESDIYFTTGEECTFSYPNTLDGVVGTTTLLPNTRYVIAIKDNRMVISYDGFDPSQYQVNVIDSNPTLSWGTTSQVGTINGTALRVTMPSNPTITNLYTESGATQSIGMSNLPKYVVCSTPLTSLSITGVSRTAAPLYVYFTVATDDEVDINFSYSNQNEPLTFVGITNSFIAGSYYMLLIKDGVCYIYEDGGGVHGFMPTPQVQADWNETYIFSDAYIQNKPTMNTETWTFTLSDNSTVTRTVYIVPAS